MFWPLTYLAITASLVGVLGVLGPGFATQVLGLTERDFVVVVLPLGAGLVVGILLLNIYGRYIPMRRGIEGGLIGLGIALAALAIAQPVRLAINFAPSISLLSMVVVVAFAAGTGVWLRCRARPDPAAGGAPADIRGRVFGVLNMLVSVASFLPIILVGPIADTVGASPVVLAAALLVLLAAAAARSCGPNRRARLAGSPSTLLEPADPVGVTSRSLTGPVSLRYVDDKEADTLSYLSSPVVPGHAGPARGREKEGAAQK